MGQLAFRFFKLRLLNGMQKAIRRGVAGPQQRVEDMGRQTYSQNRVRDLPLWRTEAFLLLCQAKDYKGQLLAAASFASCSFFSSQAEHSLTEEQAVAAAAGSHLCRCCMCSESSASWTPTKRARYASIGLPLDAFCCCQQQPHIGLLRQISC